MRVGQSTRWLVKSNGRILGPYNDRQVFDLLRDKIIVPLDEISKPYDRWSYIRDEPIFAKIVEEIRLRNLRGIFDETTTRGDETTSVTKTVSIHQQPDELTADIYQVPSPGSDNVQDIFFQSMDEGQVFDKETNKKNLFTYDGDKFVSVQSNMTARWAWIASSVVILFALGFVVFQRFVAQPIHTKSAVSESTGAGIEALERGDYTKALEYFEKVYLLDPQDTSIYLYLGLLKIQSGDQPFQGRKLLEKLKENQDKDMKRVLAGIGLAYLKEGNFKAAEENFNKALDIDPLFTPAVINLGATAMYQEDWAKASNHLLLAVKDGSTDGAEYLMLAEVFLRLYQKEQDKKYLQEGQKYLAEYLLKARNYYLESKIGILYFRTLLGDSARTYDYIEKILNIDFDETENIRQNIFIHRARADWGLVSQWCLKLTSELDPNARVIAFESLCLMKSGDVVEANRKINDAVAQSPKDPLVLSTYAYVLEKMNLHSSLGAVIQRSIDNDKNAAFTQPLRLKANFCKSENNKDCEIIYWKSLYEKDQRSLDALANLSQIYLHNNNIPEAKKYLLRGLHLSSSYKPFFNLNMLISRAEDKAKARGL